MPLSIKKGIAKTALTVLAVFGALAVFVFWKADPLQISEPSDESVIDLFHAHRTEFERLRQMVTEDMHGKSLFSESNLENISPEVRRDEYKSLLKISSGLFVAINYDKSVRFILARGGLMAIGPGWVKGLQFLPDGAKLLGTRVESLDGSRRLSAGAYFREIEPNWFILYQRDD